MSEQFEPDFNYHFIWESCLGTKVYVHVDWYYAGTNFPINSASIEPNDVEEVQFSCYYASGEEVTEIDLHPEESWVLKQLHQLIKESSIERTFIHIDAPLH